jgi:hypothetical protein
MKATQFVLCRSDQGDGGWSLHPPGSTDRDIAQGDAPILASGPASWSEAKDAWDRPNAADYRAARRAMPRDRPFMGISKTRQGGQPK